MKRIVLSILMACSMIPAINATKLKNIDPKKVIFCWDIHDTLLKQDTHGKFHSTLERDLHLASLPEAHSIYKDLQDLYGFCAGEYMEDACHKLAQEYLDKAAQVSKQGNKKLAKKYRKTAKRLLKLIKAFHKFELSYTYQDGIKPFLDTLKSDGYTHHHVASNIAERHYELIKNKFADIFNNEMIKDGLIIDVRKSPELKKPHPDYFKKLNTMLNPHGDKTLVFIDDKKTNVDAACNSGIIGIQIKTVDQLMSDLHNMGLNVSFKQQNIEVNGKQKPTTHIA